MKFWNPQILLVGCAGLLFGMLAPFAQAQEALPHAAQVHAEAGAPFVATILPEEYDAGVANWAIIQDADGVLYVGNDSGLLIYDGAHWERISAPGTVRSLALGPDGRVLVGGRGELGYVDTDSTGRLSYYSLLPHIPEEHRRFNDVWRIGTHQGRAYFGAPQVWFVWDGAAMKVMERPRRLALIHQMGDTFVAGDFDDGLLRPGPDSLEAVPGGAAFIRGTMPAFALMRYDAEHLLVGTRSAGLFLVGPDGARPFPTDADALLREGFIYHGTSLGEGLFAFGTSREGVVILNSNGERVQHIKEALPDPNVLYLYQDDEGGLWAATRAGLARIAYPSPLTYFDESQGLTAGALALARFEGTLHVGGRGGLFLLQPGGGSAASLGQHPTIGTQDGPILDAMLVVDDALFIADRNPVRLRQGQATVIGPETSLSPQEFYRSRLDPKRLYVPTFNGLALLRQDAAGVWRYDRRYDEGPMQVLNTDLEAVSERPDGSLLALAAQGSLFRVILPTASDSGRVAEVAGVPEAAGFMQLFEHEGTAYLTVSRAPHAGPTFFRYDDASRTLHPDSLLGPAFLQGERGVFKMAADATGNLWLRAPTTRYPHDNVVAWRTANGYEVDEHHLAHLPAGTVYSILAEGDSVVWFGTRDALYRYDRRLAWTLPDRPLRPRLSQVFLLSDSSRYGGALPERLDLAPDERALRFSYGLPRYQGGDAVAYQFRLDGLDETWSAWTDEATKDYAGLPAGRYLFRVRARDAVGMLSEEATFGFRIRAPWYARWWAYLGYGLLLAAGLILLTKTISQARLKRQVKLLQAEQRVQEERQRISRDLHDHVGAQLSNIIAGVELIHLSAEHGDVERMLKYLDGLDGDARGTMARLRETIWAIHQEAVTVENFFRQLRTYAEERTKYQEGLSIQAFLEASPTAAALTLRPTRALHLFRIAQEAISNTVKHAEAQQIVLRLRCDAGGQMELVIEDDGSFKPPAEHTGGHGLKTMEGRAAEIEGKLEIDASGRGTKVRVIVPDMVA